MTPASPDLPAPEASARAPRGLAAASAALCGGLAVVLAVFLAPQWRSDPELAHGWLLPVVCGLLLWAARHERGRRQLTPGPAVVAAVAACGAAAGLALAAAGLFAVSLGWSLAIVGFLCAAAFAAAWLATALVLAQAPLGILPWSWSTVAIAPLCLLAAPPPPGTAAVLTARLQIWVTGSVMSALNLLGIPARQHGNLIELASTTVGVEEACSGIRSLVSCVFVAIFLSAWLVPGTWRRVLLVALAAPLAIGMNLLRSLALTLLANAGVSIAGGWHDVTGYAILGVTAVLLALLAAWLGRAPAPPPPPAAAAGSRTARRAAELLLAGTLAGSAALTVFFVVQTRAPREAARPAPDLAALLPDAWEGWTVETTRDLARFTGILQTDHLVQRTYLRGSGDALEQLTVYVAYWSPGQASVSTVALHTPDACWPGVGWDPVPAQAGRLALTLGGRSLPPAEERRFVRGDFAQNVWFWHLAGGAPVAVHDPRSPRELLRAAWRYGFQRDHEQLFVRVSSNRPWASLATEPLVAEIFARLRPCGL